MNILNLTQLSEISGRAPRTIIKNRQRLIDAGHCIQVGARFLYLPPAIEIMKNIPETRGRPRKKKT